MGSWIDELLQRHERGLVTYASRLLGDVHRARDVVQDTFLRLLDRGQAMRSQSDEALAKWLFTTCRRRALDLRRSEDRMKSREETVAAEAREETGTTAAAELERAETVGSLRHLVEQLPPAQQEAVRLRFQHDLSYRQIAEITGSSIGNVGFLLHRAMESLRRRVQAQHGSLRG